jgi:hypothetical protein
MLRECKNDLGGKRPWKPALQMTYSLSKPKDYSYKEKGIKYRPINQLNCLYIEIY